MLSLNARLLLAASIVSVAFLSFTGFALDRAFTDSGIVAVKEKLQTEIYSLLAAADSDDVSTLVMPEKHPDTRFSTPASGIYAEIISDEGRVIWRSDSMLGVQIAFEKINEKGVPQFTENKTAMGMPLYTLGLGVMWEVAPFIERGYSFYVAETQQHFENERKRFRKSLASWLSAAVFALLFVQAIILRWGLSPLRKVATEVNEIEAGRQTELSSGYPQEIDRLATNLNALIRTSNSQLKRYRNALGDLAHSLKTPLTVLRNIVEAGNLPRDIQSTVSEQVERLDKTVEYQLQKAVASGRKVFSAPIKIQEVAQKLLNTFKKVYVEKQIRYSLNLNGDLTFIGDEGDLMEILGNLTDNACKWCTNRVSISAYTTNEKVLTLEVEDDGPGIAREVRESILKRGVRADSQVEGHGIGLAVVRNLVEEVYQGKLKITDSDLGGARISVILKK